MESAFKRFPALLVTQAVVGMLAIIMTIAASILLVPILEKRADMQAQIDTLNNEKAVLTNKNETLTKQQNDLKRQIQKIEAVYNKKNQTAQAAQFNPIATSDHQADANGQTTIHFSLKLSVPPLAAQNIENVTYHFDDPQIPIPIVTSTDAHSGFATSYISKTCVNNITIQIRFMNGTTSSAIYDMCSLVGW